MKFSRMIIAVDSHTMGEPTRVVVGGIPHIPGNTMAEKKAYLEQNMDHIRTALMHEPRGHRDMFGSIITAPVNQEADFGIIFMDGGGYLNMCGHGSIGAVTVAVETGMVKPVSPVTHVKLDTPAGLIEARAEVSNNMVKSVTITNVPAFLYEPDVKINVPGIGEITADISFGGSFFAIVNAKQLGIKIDPSYIDDLIKVGMAIKRAANEQIKVRHPEKEHIRTIDLVEIYDETENTNAHLKNVVIFGDGQADRSPCGTGTSAKMATLYAKGKLSLNQEFLYESIIGTVFKGRLVGETRVGPYTAVIPEITGSAYITGFNQFVIDPEDPVKYGFLLGKPGTGECCKMN
ncbi:proline racemase [Thermosediminibacter litoriperuensis]|uniref:Proline racemase n=1 Tax=Thermosediminibacter litoriperuensis TaxID=291989 RepID=A0A5S5AX58_9FIRM|nr:proline racemase [Thermosediminibacter litoriperuensis]TYP57783.1 proline racemase [Thermosediminibacter litoriperuensis]